MSGRLTEQAGLAEAPTAGRYRQVHAVQAELHLSAAAALREEKKAVDNTRSPRRCTWRQAARPGARQVGELDDENLHTYSVRDMYSCKSSKDEASTLLTTRMAAVGACTDVAEYVAEYPKLEIFWEGRRTRIEACRGLWR